jgi:hypothetical protein
MISMSKSLTYLLIFTLVASLVAYKLVVHSYAVMDESRFEIEG